MKRIMTTFAALSLLVCFLLSAVPVYADEPLAIEDITATNISGPINPNASQEAKNLLAYMQTMLDTNRFITGTFDYSNESSVYDAVKEQYGKEVGLYSNRYYVSNTNGYDNKGVHRDFMEFYHVDTANRELKKHYDNGNILLVHADGLFYGGDIKTYMDANGIPEEGAIHHLDATNPDRDLQLYSWLMEYQQKVVDCLKELEDMGVKAYMYRTWVEYNYHEEAHANSDESIAAMRRVHQQTATFMCNSGLTGFLMTYSPGEDNYTTIEERYPGNEYVDVLSVTFYSHDDATDKYKIPGKGGNLHSTCFKDYEWYVRTGKPFGLSENSCRTGDYTIAGSIGRQSWYNTLTSMITYFPRICWVNAWADGHYSLVNHTDGNYVEGNDDGYLYVNSPYSVTLDQMPDYRAGVIPAPGVVQLYTEKNYGGNWQGGFSTDYVGLEERAYTAADLKALGLEAKDIASFHVNTDYGILFYESKDATGDGYSYINSCPETEKLAMYDKFRSAKVVRLNNVALELGEIYASDNDDNAYKANDGLLSKWTGRTDENGTGWLMIDLGSVYTVNRWVVRHDDGVASYNTEDFELQYSADGENWITADSVKGNREGLTDRTLANEVVAQYFRLYITDPNRITSGMDIDLMTITEWELYGLPNAASVDQSSDDEPESEEESEPESGDDTKPEDTESDEDTDSESVGEDEDTAPEEEPDSGTSSPEEKPAPDGSGDEPVTDGDDSVTDEETEDPQESLPDEETTEPDTEDEDSSGNKKKPVQIVTTETYFPWWAWLLIGLGVLAAAGVVVIILLARKKKAKAE